MTHFESMMSKKTVEELTEYIDNFERYTSLALTAAINELKKRGVAFSDEELNSLYEKIEKKKEFEEEDDSIFGYSKLLQKNVVTDPNAPLLYSRKAVLGFSIVFTVIFGAVLLSLNIERKVNKIKVIGFGVLFTTIAILLANVVSLPTFSVFFLNGLGGYLLSFDFWNKYVGRETKYRSKPIWIPLLISIIIMVLYYLGTRESVK